MHWASLPAMFFAQAERYGAKPLVWSKRDGIYQPLSWREAADQVRLLAAGFVRSGVQPGDRILLVAESRPEWLIADLAIMTAGAVTVPAYTTNTEHDHLHILTNSGARGAIVSTAALARRLLPAARSAPTVEFVITMDPLPLGQAVGPQILTWAEALAAGEGATPIPLTAARDSLACIIYTSGTGGVPKGVMTTHGAILHNCAGALELVRPLGLGDDVFLSFLPLSHSYEHTAGQFFPLTIGAEIYYAEGADALAANLREARPTILTAVPRLYESLRARILRDLKRRGGWQEKLFHQAVALGSRAYQAPETMSLGERGLNRLLDWLVRRKVAARFGGRLKAVISGGAPLNTDVGLFFLALGVPLLQGYGQTESGPVVSCNPPRRVKLHTVGPPLADVDVAIAPDGEILVRGELVMKGYWGDEKASAEALRDGWLHTGDVGMQDGDGYIQITDRKKDIIVNSGGDNISPQRIEGFLILEPEIAQAVVFGDGRPHLVALLVPDPALAAECGGEDESLRKGIGAAVERVNGRLSNIEKVRRFLIAPEPFTIENSQMTPSLKVRRHVIRKIYGPALDALYDGPISRDNLAG